MDPYAVIETGGKQYRVRENDKLEIERIKAEKGDRITPPRVLAVSDGKELKIGAPDVEGAEITLEVLDHIRGKKTVSFKKKRRKGYSRKTGHRQELTVVKVAAINQA